MNVHFGSGADNTNHGTGETESLVTSELGKYAHSWSPDGRALAYYVVPEANSRDIRILPMEGTAHPYLFWRRRSTSARRASLPTAGTSLPSPTRRGRTKFAYNLIPAQARGKSSPSPQKPALWKTPTSVWKTCGKYASRESWWSGTPSGRSSS